MTIYDDLVTYIRSYEARHEYNDGFLVFLNVLMVALLLLSLCALAGSIYLLATTQPLAHPVYCIIAQESTNDSIVMKSKRRLGCLRKA